MILLGFYSEKKVNKKLNIFLDTCIINRILEIDNKCGSDATYEEDRLYLSKILDFYSNRDEINFFVNPTVKSEIDNTNDNLRRAKLMEVFDRYDFMSFSVSIFPISFPVTFFSEEESEILDVICEKNPELKKDKKIIADSAFCKEIDILVTADKNLAEVDIQNFKIFTPRELFEHLSKTYNSIDS